MHKAHTHSQKHTPKAKSPQTLAENGSDQRLNKLKLNNSRVSIIVYINYGVKDVITSDEIVSLNLWCKRLFSKLLCVLNSCGFQPNPILSIQSHLGSFEQQRRQNSDD